MSASTSKSDLHQHMDSSRGLAQGGLGGESDQLLEDGQQEVFARDEVERGVIEHHAQTTVSPSNP